jgi:hypothetical protein
MAGDGEQSSVDSPLHSGGESTDLELSLLKTILVSGYIFFGSSPKSKTIPI